MTSLAPGAPVPLSPLASPLRTPVRRPGGGVPGTKIGQFFRLLVDVKLMKTKWHFDVQIPEVGIKCSQHESDNANAQCFGYTRSGPRHGEAWVRVKNCRFFFRSLLNMGKDMASRFGVDYGI